VSSVKKFLSNIQELYLSRSFAVKMREKISSIPGK